jgi:hypothetical protein
VSALDALQRFARAPGAPPEAVEHCEICAEPVPGEHRHLVDLERRSLACACRGCVLLFSRPEPMRYRLIPERVCVDPALVMADWSALQIPVQLAFVFFDSSLRRWVAVYPGAAGPTQAVLPEGTWLEQTALARAAAPDVEALLVRGERGAPAPREVFLVPIDLCYALVGLVRRRWRGFSGGDVWEDVDRFMDDVRRRARPLEAR